MSELRSKIPSPQSLFAFEAAARARNFARAAEELNVTQSSISHAIRKLEKHLGVQLFKRANRGVSLTGSGQVLFEAVNGGFVRINSALDEIGRRELTFVTIAVSTSMATYWLMPQLHDFYRNHPRIKLKILTTDKNVEPDDNIDLTIRLLPISSDRKNVWMMAKETVFPVCSRTYLSDSPPLSNIRDLLNHRLLYYEDPHRPRINWPEFLAKLQISPQKADPDLVFNDYQVVLQSAMAGEGIAIGWTITAQTMLDKGLLIRPLAIEVTTENAFFIMGQPSKTMRKEVGEIVRWLLAQSKQLR